VSVRAAAARIIAADFFNGPTDSPLPTEVAQRLAVATQQFKMLEMLFCYCCVHFKDGCATFNGAKYVFCNIFMLSAIHTVPFVIFVIG